MDPEQLAAAVAVADESLAAQTTDYRLQAAIAQDRPDLWAALASNPTTYPSLLTWLSSIQEPAVQRALEARGIAPQAETVPQTGEGAPEEGQPDEPAEPQADGGAPEELAGPQAVDDAESQADGAAPEEAAEPQAAEDVPAEASEPGAGVVLSEEEAAESRADEAEKTGSEPEDETEPQEPAEPQTDGSAPADAGEPQKGEDAPEAAAEPQVDKTVPVVLPLKAPPAPSVASSAPSVASSAGASASPSVSPFSADFASHAMAAASNSSYASSGSFVPTQDRTAASRGSAASPPRSRKLMIVTLVLALLLAGGTGGWFLMSAIYKDSPVALSLPGTGRKTHQGKKSARDSATSDSDSRSVSAADDPAGTSATNYVTPCGSAPTFTPTSVKNGEGELKVEVKVTASCPSGDVLGGTANHIEMKGPSRSDGTGSADALIASGDFDFSDSPLVIPDSGTSLMLRFGDGHFFRTADDVDVKTVTVDCTPDRDSGAGGATAGTSSASGSSGPSSAAASTTSRDSTSEESAAGSSLRWQADHDKPTITRSLTGKWVAQLSSKKPGLVADGITWDNRATLQEFLELRQKYPSAKLLYSEDWPVFDAGGQYWVTIAGTPYSTAAEANAWCEAQGFDAEHCFAKYIDTKGPSEGTTVNR